MKRDYNVLRQIIRDTLSEKLEGESVSQELINDLSFKLELDVMMWMDGKRK